MKNICFISQCSLPIPTVKGGAVETLVEYLITENEKNGKYHFTVISIEDDEALRMSKDYINTEFVYVKKANNKANAILFLLYRILKHIGIYIPFSLEFKEALKALKKCKDQDLYIFEAGPTTQLPALARIVPKEKLFVHVHWDGMGTKRKDKCFSRLLPVSDYIGAQWKEATGCSDEKIVPLYNCAKIQRFDKESTSEEKNELREKLGIPSDNKVIIFTGRIVQEKGVKELLLAYEKIDVENVTLIIIGSANFGAQTNTKYETEVADIISSSKKQIVFTGYVHQTMLYRYYNIANVAVMPSLFQDPAPLVGIETQASGTALISTNVGGIHEYVTKDSAILVEMDDKLVDSLKTNIEKVLLDDQLSHEMGLAGKENAKQYDIENYYERFSQIVDHYFD